jgi:DUF1009 family protein
MKTKSVLFVLRFQNKMIGLFLGSTDFPELIIKKFKKSNKKYFIIDLTNNNKFKKDKNSHYVSIGQFGKILKLIKKMKCNTVLFAGKIEKPKLSLLRLDIKGFYYLPRIIKAYKIGDASILKELIKILAEHKIKVISSIAFNSELTLVKGFYTRLKPDKNDIISISKGIKSLANVNSFNHVQALVIRNSSIIAKETSRGTKRMLQLIKRAKNYQGILIKYPKKRQDKRVDLPTMGLDTLKDCKKAGIKGIILKSKQNIFLDKNKSIYFANKNNIFICVK